MLSRGTLRFASVAAVLGLLAVSLVVAEPGRVPHRYNPRSLDGALFSLVNPVDGKTWSAWSYRNGAEYDIAISTLDAAGAWSEPAFIGQYDGVDQIQPSLAVDPYGNLYVVFAERGRGAIRLAALPFGASTWLGPGDVTQDGERGMQPAVSVAGGRLIIAFRSGQTTVIRDFELLPPTVEFNTRVIHDGPDPFGITAEGSDEGGWVDMPGDGRRDHYDPEKPGDRRPSDEEDGRLGRRGGNRTGNPE